MPVCLAISRHWGSPRSLLPLQAATEWAGCAAYRGERGGASQAVIQPGFHVALARHDRQRSRRRGIYNYNFETLELMRESLSNWVSELPPDAHGRRVQT